MSSVPPKMPHHIPSFVRVQLIVVSISTVLAIGLIFDTERTWIAGAAIMVNIRYLAESLFWLAVFKKPPVEDADDRLMNSIHRLRVVLFFLILLASWYMRILDSSAWASAVFFNMMLSSILMGAMFSILARTDSPHMGRVMRGWNFAGSKKRVARKFSFLFYFFSALEFLMVVFSLSAPILAASYIVLPIYLLVTIVMFLVIGLFSSRKRRFDDLEVSEEPAVAPAKLIKVPDFRPRGPKVFISYRRSDTAHLTGRIYDALSVRMPEEDIFYDVDSIPISGKFREVIADGMSQSAALLAIIGPRWENPIWTKRRWLEPGRPEEDFVEVELLLALELGVPVIPVLIDGTPMPRAEDLPPSIRPISEINAASIRGGKDFRVDMNKIWELVEPLRNQGLM